MVPSDNLEAFLSVYSPASHEVANTFDGSSDSGQGISVYGIPYHASPDELIKRYRQMALNDFLAYEARYSVGNYVLTDQTRESVRIVTAPGYCGGYYTFNDGKFVVGTVCSEVLSAMSGPVRMDTYGLGFYLGYGPKSSFQQLPYTTPFEGVTRLPQAALLEVKGNEISVFRSYVTDGKKLTPPKSFNDAIDETSSQMADYYADASRGDRRSPAVMFSGGADSLIIYLALRDKMNAADIQAVTMHQSQHSITNGPLRAVPIAEKLGFKLDFISDDYLQSSKTADVVFDLMQRDFPNGRGPHVALGDFAMQDRDLLHGQNMDSIININMAVSHATLEQGYMTRAMAAANATDNPHILAQYKFFIGNFQYTHMYMRDINFQRSSIGFFQTMNKMTQPAANIGRDGVFHGVLSSQIPNLVMSHKLPFEQNLLFDAETAKHKAFVGSEGSTPQYMLDLIRHYSWNHLAHKRLSSQTLPTNCRVFPPATGGPISTYYLGKNRGVREMAQPKRELYAAIRQRAGGISYTDLFKEQAKPEKWRQGTPSIEDPLIDGAHDLLSVQNSLVLASIGNDVLRDHIEATYRQVGANCFPKDPGFNRLAQSRARAIINLELIMQTVEKTRAEKQITP